MKTITIKTGDVKVGDRIYNAYAPNPAFNWVTVRQVTQRGYYVELHTDAWVTAKHRREGIAVQREDHNISKSS